MKLLTPFWGLCTAALIGGFVLSENPNVVPQAEATAQHVADALHSIIVGAPAPTAPPLPVLPFPHAQVSATRGGSTSPGALVPPIVLVIPTAAAVPATHAKANWSVADCAWASSTLTRDAQLDLAEAAAVQNGSDTRYGTGAWLVSSYRNYAAEWTAVNLLVTGVCRDRAAPTQAQISQAQGWFAQAEQAHAADNSTHPADANWNNAWIRDYQRLAALFASLPQ